MESPDIILITVDSLRSDAVGFLNGNAPSTPGIDAFAEDATLATDAFAPSTHTRASVPAILSSQFSHNFFMQFLEDTQFETIAQRLSAAGYETAAFHSNPLLSRHFGYDRGFDTFYDSLHFVEDRNLPEIATRIYSKAVRLVRRHPYEPAEKLTQRASEWLSDVDSPFFLWVHYMDPHGPYTLDRERGYLDKFSSERLWHKAVSSPTTVTKEEQERLRNAYRGEVEYTDYHVNALLDTVRERSNPTQVLLTGDHGEEFGEHGGYSHSPKLYDTVVRVPFVLDLPDREDARGDTGAISLLDIMPTLLCDIDDLESLNHQGAALQPAIDGKSSHRSYVILETNPKDGDPMIGVRNERWKLIEHGGESEFYDLSKDPEEQENISGQGRGPEERLREVLVTHTFESDVTGGDKLDQESDEMNDEMQNRLEDLGYL